jgi:hypothetical protein
MKLYTEEQVIDILQSGSFPFDDEEVDEILLDRTPIELPSDEEIEKFSKIFNLSNNRDMFITGAHWVLNQIKQQDEIN